MKKFNFSKLFFVAALVASFVMLSGCKPEVETITEHEIVILDRLDSGDSLIGDWESSWGEKYSISSNDYDNYFGVLLYYSTTDIVVRQLSETSGYIYGKFDDEDHLGLGAKLNQWYALYYQNLGIHPETHKEIVSFGQPYKAGGKAACNTLLEAIKEFTIENGYYDLSNLSECTK